MGGRKGGRKGGRVDGWTGGRADRQTGGRADTWAHQHTAHGRADGHTDTRTDQCRYDEAAASAATAIKLSPKHPMARKVLERAIVFKRDAALPSCSSPKDDQPRIEELDYDK